MLQAELKVIGGKHDGTIIPLATKRFLIGREQDCHLRPNSELVSRHHCVVCVDDYTVRIRELGSTNGTYVNGERIHSEVVLKSGDRISIGKLEFEVNVGEKVPVEAPVPAPADTDGPAPQVPNDPEHVRSEETAHVSSSETDYELPTSMAEPVGNSAEPPETAVLPVQPPQQAPGQYAPPPGQYPPPPEYNYGMPPHYPYPPPAGGPYPPGLYPQHPGMYPPPGGMYPQQPGAYPPPGAYPQPAGQPDQQNNPRVPDLPPVKLPPPEETGVRETPAENLQSQNPEQGSS